MNCRLTWIATGIMLFFAGRMVCAGDWPMWRFDATRSAASTERLADRVQLSWTRDFGARQQAWDDPLNLDLMTYDRLLEPIVMDGRMFVSLNDRDQLVAVDVQTGSTLWSYFADGPIRLAPVAWEGRVYVCSDDGCLHCVRAADGQLEWKFRGASSTQMAIGNERLISAWPARGGPVIRDETIYFAASIWPFMGTFIHALDARTGEVLWTNDSTGADYIKQPHSAPSFAGVAPQGALVATEELLVVPGGRSVPAVMRRQDGQLEYFEINAGGKGTGGSFVVADERHYYVHTRLKGTRAFNLATGVKTAFTPNEPVLHDGLVYSAETEKDRAVIVCYGADHKPLWKFPADGRGDLILSGGCLYAAGNGQLTAIELLGKEAPDQVKWQLDSEVPIERLLAANGMLFGVTSGGRILAYAAPAPTRPEAGRQAAAAPTQPIKPTQAAARRAQRLLELGDSQGYALWFGATDRALVGAFAARSPFTELAVFDEHEDVVADWRERLDAAGLYGPVTAHISNPMSVKPPRYIANMVFVDGNLLARHSVELVRRLYQSVRPYGGTLCVFSPAQPDGLAKQLEALQLEQAEIEAGAEHVVIRRVGALPGAADWTHQYGDIANTIKSDDQRVKLPLGLLWFGGSSNVDVLPRHGHGPPEQVVGGRLYLQGINSLSARDVYTGRVLWKRQFEDLGTFDVYYDKTYEDTPLNPKYNQVHIPGANGRGTNYVVTSDRIYILEKSVCHVLDPATGESLTEIEMPADESGEQMEWGFIGVYQDVLIGGQGFARYGKRNGLTFESDKNLKGSRAGFGTKSLDRAASLGLVVFDRYSGEPLWRARANHSFWHNGIVAGGGRVYCLDKTPKLIEEALRRRGRLNPAGHRIVAFDYRTGEQQWEVKENIFGTWLGYSEEFDRLLQAGAAASDRLYSEVGQGMVVYAGAEGEVVWSNDSLKYAGPCILHNDWILTNANSYSDSAGAFHIEDGRQKMVPNPLTGELQPWRIARAYGCNNIIASEHLLTFRSGAAGFYDLLTQSGTGNFGGFKSGCTSNLVVANGVLNAPDYTRTCSCAYQNQTSLALVHMPEIELWTVNRDANDETQSKRIHQLGINFGAPGDRRDTQGSLWLEYPVVSGTSPPLLIEFNDGVEVVRNHSSAYGDAKMPWVVSSGINGITDLRIGMDIQDGFNLAEGLPVRDGNDDAEESEDGNVSLGSSDLELVEDSATQLVGLRFQKVNLDSTSRVRNAYIQFVVDEVSDDPTSLIISAEDSGNAAAFSSDQHDLSSRTRGSIEVGWQPEAWKKTKAAGAAQRTPDLTELINSILQRPDWKPGNSLVFLISGSGKRVAMAAKGLRSSGAARLVVDAETYRRPELAKRPERDYRVRLLFGCQFTTDSQPRVFDVYAQNQLVAENLTLAPDQSQSYAAVEHVIPQVRIGSELKLRFVPKQGQPVLSGIELIDLSSQREQP